jgi:DNA-directed RNA polymerase specialized sigma24 family protein
MAISKNLWLQRLDRKYRLLYQSDCAVYESQGAYAMEDQALQEENLEQQRIFYKHLMLLPPDCRHLLQLYCLKIPYKEIARMLKFKDEVYVKTRKYTCKNLLRKKIMNDPDYKLLLAYDRKGN